MALSQPFSHINCSAQSIPYPILPGARIRSLEASTVQKGWQYIPGVLYPNNGAVSSKDVRFCNVTITYTPLESSNKTTVQVWLPTKEWNGRMQGLGGSGWAAGLHESGFPAMTAAVIQGYTAVSTNGGYHSDNPKDWALLRPGKVDIPSLQHFATTSLNDLAIIGKSIVRSFYGQPPKHSYWNGCSQGGRQGYMLAQRYPKAFDGIVASAPVVNWSQLMVAGFWAQLIMNGVGKHPRACELSSITDTVIEICDGNDGLIDGLISDPDSCNFDPYTLIGTPATSCWGSDAPRKISASAALLARTGWTGMKNSTHPYMWYGTNEEASLVSSGISLVGPLFSYLNVTYGLADTECHADGTCYGKPFHIVADWIKYFVEKDPNYDLSKMDQKEFDRAFQVSVDEFAPIIGTDSVDLSGLREAGGKLLSYHGLADSVIPSRNTRRYYEAVMTKDPSVHDYYRHFEAPGVGHCNTATGLYPSGIFDSLVKWVEQGVAPDSLEVDVSGMIGATKRRILCPHPQRSHYKGTGNAWSLSNFYCAT